MIDFDTAFSRLMGHEGGYVSTSALLTSLQGAAAAVKADTGLIKVAVL